MGLTVRIDGLDAAEASKRVQSLTVVDAEEDSADTCELTLAIGDNRVAVPRRGAKMRFLHDGAQIGGAYAVNRISGSIWGGVMHVKGQAYDIRNDLRSARSASFSGRSLKDILSTVSARYGLEASTAAELTELIPAEAVQTAESDLAFLRRIANAVGAKFSVKDGRLLISRQGKTVSASGQPLPSTLIDALDPDVAIAWEASDRETRKVVARYFAEDGVTLQAETFGNGQTSEMLPDVYPSRDAAMKAGEKAIAKLQPDSQSLTVDTKLRLDLAAGYPVDVSGLPAGLARNWKILSVTHYFSAAQPQKSSLRCGVFVQ